MRLQYRSARAEPFVARCRGAVHAFPDRRIRGEKWCFNRFGAMPRGLPFVPDAKPSGEWHLPDSQQAQR
jgi:hypothetical protein